MKSKRYPINWTELRDFVLERDNNTCQHCGCKHEEIRTNTIGQPYKAYLQVAHLDHDPENHQIHTDRLLSLCQPCHLKNDRENSERLIKIFLSGRISTDTSKGLSKPQTKSVIKGLQLAIQSLENELIIRDKRIEALIAALEAKESVVVEQCIDNKPFCITEYLQRKNNRRK